ncbi:MAG: hypothetical protein JSV71_01275 [Nitrospiraceae bacterium]|nr:MAG: hypothetical protein JSV71_01275 [Nitrospiraceae bacterium]
MAQGLPNKSVLIPDASLTIATGLPIACLLAGDTGLLTGFIVPFPLI